ncbi:MAG TPA: hypothetical protein PKA37_01210 [Planctomycetota bacterium]|jgi:hypothetical protein|nr:hypothetical protein [Planctomycetota bacterium]
MNLVIKCCDPLRGERLYSVYGDGERFFTGTMDEVKRYVVIHYAKIRERRKVEEAILAKVRSAG